MEACVWGLIPLLSGECGSAAFAAVTMPRWSWSASEREERPLELALHELGRPGPTAGSAAAVVLTTRESLDTTVESLTFLRRPFPALENLLRLGKRGDFLPGVGLGGWGDTFFWPVCGYRDIVIRCRIPGWARRCNNYCESVKCYYRRLF